MKVKFLPEKEIEVSANILLDGYKKQFDISLSPPIPVDEIAECHLELDLRFDDLCKLFRRTNVLGAIWIKDKRIKIDESLEPFANPLCLGRYRFTLSHELGHWCLHRDFLLARSAQLSLFDATNEPSVICRAGDTAPEEWQANTFASYLLMPEQMIFDAWEELHGNFSPVFTKGGANFINGNQFNSGVSTTGVARKMAEKFEVSVQAMEIRLKSLNLLKNTVASPVLFNKY